MEKNILGNSPFIVEFPAQKASDAELWCFYFDLHMNKLLAKQSWGWWFETPSVSLWRHYNEKRDWGANSWDVMYILYSADRN